MRSIKPQKDEYMINASKKGESEPRYPSFRLDLEHIPEAKNWKLGEDYEIEMKVKLVGLSQSKFDNGAEFEIKEIGTEDEEDESEEEED